MKTICFRWAVFVGAFAICAAAFGQSEQPKPNNTPKSRNADNWDEVCRDFDRAFKNLGRQLSDEQTWAEVGRELSEAGREADRALRNATRDWDSRWDANGRFDVERVKKFSRSFRLGANQQFSVENKFGKVHVNTWDKPEATVDVVMTARSSNETKAQTLLDRISIVVEEKAGNEISVKTQIESLNNWGNGKQSFEINYTVNVPRNSPLRIKNSFGDTYVAETNGRADLQASYGSLKADRLNHADNTVKVAFGNGRIGYCKSGELKVSYSDFEVTEGGNLEIESSFSELQVRNAQSAVVKARYGSVDLGTDGRAFKRFDVDGSFSDIDLRLPPNFGFDFDVKVSFADVDLRENNARFATVEKSGNSKTYVGTCGKTATGSIRVNSKYGNVDFKERD